MCRLARGLRFPMLRASPCSSGSGVAVLDADDSSESAVLGITSKD